MSHPSAGSLPWIHGPPIGAVLTSNRVGNADLMLAFCRAIVNELGEFSNEPLACCGTIHVCGGPLRYARVPWLALLASTASGPCVGCLVCLNRRFAVGRIAMA